MSRVVVIGGGVIGAACAYYLRRSDWDVTIVERKTFGSGCSHGNCGFVCPSHVLPLAMPGAIRSGLKALLDPNGPFRIKPRLDVALWSWLLKFARRCNARDMLQAGMAIQALLKSSRHLYDNLLNDEQLDCEWQARGLLFVLQTQSGMEHYAATDRLLHDRFGLAARRLDGEALVVLEPALKPGLAGGWHYDTDAHLRPDKLMSAWRDCLVRHRVTIRENCEVEAFVRSGSQAKSVRTNGGDLAADAFVVAAGALTPTLGRDLGCRLPIQPGKGYSITMNRPSRCPTLPLIFEEHRVAITPMPSAYRIGSTMEFAGYDSTLNRKRLNLLRDGASPYLHEPFGEPVIEEWYGWRPMTPDSIPIIGPGPAMGNVIIAAGHNMLGLSMATGTGQLVTALLDGRVPPIDPSPYAATRF
jgi:D-amino-acid dehydrogenase